MLLEVNGLTKHFGTITALDNLNLAITEGEFFALLGPSASGKTTALRAITGIQRPDSGRILFAGQDITEAPVQGRPMAMVFQTFALYPHLSVYDNLAYPLREAKTDRATVRRRVNEIADMLRITHTLKRKPETASGGEQQRIAIGRALIRQPKLLLLDEPITNLDAKLRHDTRAEFKRLHRDLGMTIIYATPDELEAMSMGQRIGLLREGTIVQVDTPDHLYDNPENTFVASMIGSPKMNLVPATRQGNSQQATIALDFATMAQGPWDRALADFPVGSNLLFGFRPHDVTPVAADQHGATTFTTRVRLTEPLGDITVIDLLAGDNTIKMVLPEKQALDYRIGDEVAVALDLSQSHVFAAETGVAIR